MRPSKQGKMIHSIKQMKIVAALLLLSACLQPGLSATFTAPPLKSLDLEVYRDPYNDALGLVRYSVKKYMSESNFASLESLAKKCAERPKASPNGYTHTDIFFDAFDMNGLTEPEFKTWQEKFQKWRALYPNSDVATLAEAFYWLEYAWVARGSGYANTVSDEGWRRFSMRQQKAKALLDSIPQKQRTPSWYVCMLRLAQNLEMPDEEHNKLYGEAITAFPGSTSVYFRQAIDYLPRWGGSAELWEQFAAESIKKAGKVDPLKGDALYTQIVYMLLIDWGESDYSKVDSEKLHKGFDAMRKLYPKDPTIDAMEARLALAMENYALARQVFKTIGPVIDIGVWNSKRNFIKMREKAFASK